MPTVRYELRSLGSNAALGALLFLIPGIVSGMMFSIFLGDTSKLATLFDRGQTMSALQGAFSGRFASIMAYNGWSATSLPACLTDKVIVIDTNTSGESLIGNY